MRLLLLQGIILVSSQEIKKNVVGFGDSTTIQCPTKKPELNPTLTVWFTNDVTKVSQKILIATLGFEGGNTKVTTHYRVDEERLETDGSSVTISNVGLDDEGTYKCILDFKTDPSINEEFTTVVVRIKPEVNEIEDLTLGRPLVDYVSAGSEPKLTDVAKCTVTRAKPKADISWIYDSPNLQPEDVKTFDKPDANNKVVQTTSILQLIPEKKYNGQVVKCQVNHPELGKAIVKEHKLNVQYAPTVPTIRPSKGQGELTCLTDSNPEPTYMWKLPNGQVTSGTTIKLMDLENGNATYTCTVENPHGREERSITNQEIMLMPEKDVGIASLPIIVGIAFVGILVLICIGFAVYKFFLNPRQKEKSPYPYSNGSNRDHIVTQASYEPTPVKPNMEEDSSDDGGPILSHNSAAYHAARRSNTQLRHSPSRGQHPAPGAYPYEGKNYDDGNYGDYEEDDLVDNALHRYTDYTPAAPYKPQQQNYHGTEMV